MILARAILPTLLIFHSVWSYDSDEDSRSCRQQETFNLADMEGVLSFVGKATCRQYQKIFQFNPDPKATKGRVLTILDYSGSSYMNFDVTEFTTHHNGTIDRKIARKGSSIMGGEMRFAPNTGILLNFTRDGGSYYTYDYTFTGKIAETATHHHCPNPFMELQPYQPVVLDETFVLYACDMLVTAPKDFEVRLDHITDTPADHSTVITLNDGDGRTIDRFSEFPVEETMSGTDEVVVHVWRRSDYSHQITIQLSAVKLNCTCGASEHVFNASLTPALFETPDYPKRHCKLVSCQKTFILPVEMRTEYKMQLAPFVIKRGVMEIEDEPNGILTRNDRLEDGSFTFESPIVSFKYLPGENRQGDIFSLEMSIVKRQQGCICSHQSNLATTLYVEIPIHCKLMDCLYLMPLFDDNTITYHTERHQTRDYIGWRQRNRLSDDYIIRSGNLSGVWTLTATERMLIRFHRESPTPRPTILNFTYTTSGVHISHEERCGCFNKTVLLESNQALEFTSPDYPAHYCDNLVCVTTYVAPAHHHLEVKLDSISLEPENDRLVFFEGTNITEKHIELVTGETIIPDPISSDSTVLTTVFISNGAVAFDGFNGTITAVMDKSWTDHLKHHISGWWWLIGIILMISIGGAAMFVWKRGGLRRSRSINLMDM